MSTKRRKFQRSLGERSYRKLFVLAVEGEKTERQYFAIFNGNDSVIRVNCLNGRHGSSPQQVLKRMQAYLCRVEIRPSDEAWVVVDKDQWTDEQLTQLYEWSQTHDNYGFALSNPMFEYWLLLHFEDGSGIASSHDCINRLKRYLPEYDKEINSRLITKERICEAIRRAKLHDIPPVDDWPRHIGTTVYRLVENLLNT